MPASAPAATPAATKSTATPASAPSPAPVSAAVQQYLVAFNLVSCLSWLYVWSLIVHHLLTASDPVSSLYSRIALPLQFTQSLAALEVLHSAVGFVRSPVFTTALQVSSRLFIVWLILHSVPPTQTQVGALLCTLSWATVEVPRYAFYAWNLVSPTSVPYALTWLRYSLFIVLYPSGIAGEMLTVYTALPYLASHPKLWSLHMPNALNFGFSFYACCCLILLLYLPGSPFMINLMLRQREVVIGGLMRQQREKQLGGQTAPRAKKEL